MSGFETRSAAASSGSAGASIPIGGQIVALDAPVNFTSGDAEYLRNGAIKSYDSSYAKSIAAAPQLRVFGSHAKTNGSASSYVPPTYYYLAGKYVAVTSNGFNFGATLAALSSSTPVPMPTSLKRVASNGTYLVGPYSTEDVAPWFSSDPAVVSSVFGTFTTFPVASAVAYGNNSWIMASSLNGTANERAFINNANPGLAGGWTVGAVTTVGMSVVRAIAYGNGVFVAVGNGSPAGIIATAATAGGVWTARSTAAIGLVTGEYIVDVIFDGTVFFAHTTQGRIITCADAGVTWEDKGVVCDISELNTMSGAADFFVGTGQPAHMATDGAGTVFVMLGMTGTARPLFMVTTDHGATWSLAQEYIGKAATTPYRTVSYANGRWILNHSGLYSSSIDIGPSLDTPDYIGQQVKMAAGLFVRIK